MRNGLFVVIVIILLLTTRLGYIQLVWGAELNNQATSQQSQSRKITAKRGTIYDATGKYELAVSSSVEAVTINPTNISKENKEKVAKALSDIFELDYEKVLKRLNKRSSIETIVKQVEKSETDELRKWMEENQITRGINIDEDSKRYYPYGDLAAQVIGFCGNDNQGLDGIEAKYNDELKGTNGKIERQTNAAGESLGDEEYISAIDGNSLILTIDMTIQSIVEKYLEEACIDNVCTDGGSIIAMNPKNGDVLAMATYPAYDLNSPYEPHTDEQKAEWKNLDSQDRTTAMQKMWRNKAISDTYEPGSVFKTITSSAALEEGIVTDIDKQGQFCCTGGIEVAGVRIKCWRYYRPHGSESLRLALMNSCNPVFIGLGQKRGVTKYYEYLRKFGLFNKTGIKLPGEANSIFIKEEKAGPVELATISFGQRFEITPLQLVTAVSAIANGGDLVQPRVVKQIVDSKTGEKRDVEVKKKGNAISKETSEKVLSMMESVVAEGTGKNAKVAGYRIGGKTGTSEDGVNTGKYVTSFIGVAPIDNPQLVMLITLYNPTGEGGHQGGGVAAPLAGQIFREILPYMEINQGNADEVEQVEQVIAPDIVGKSVAEAEKLLKENGLELVLESEVEDTEALVKEQVPSAGIMVKKGSKVFAK